ncbi:peptidylprolyl isomerase [bacterium]|nr:peptidylprolyl isomerase [bacterium]
MKKILIIALSLLVSFVLIGCGNKEETTYQTRPVKKTTATVVFSEGEIPTYEIKLSNGKSINIELYPDIAPITARNFAQLVESKFYDGVVFHRVMPDFMIQTGGYVYSNNGSVEKITEKDASTIKGEFTLNGWKNDLKHTAGVVSMARATDYNSASSQFFICVADYPSLNDNYAAFGKVIDQESLDVAVSISKYRTVDKVISGTRFQNFPANPIYIETIKRTDK